MIVELEQFTGKLSALRAQLKEVGEGLHIDDMERELSELKEEMNADGFWDNLERSTHVNRRISNLEGKIKHYEGLLSGCDDVETMMELAQEENDESMLDELKSVYTDLETKMEETRLETLLTGDYDGNNALVSFQSGAGGTEAQDWCQMLYRMYTRWAEAHGFTYKILDYEDGDEAGATSPYLFCCQDREVLGEQMPIVTRLGQACSLASHSYPPHKYTTTKYLLNWARRRLILMAFALLK